MDTAFPFGLPTPTAFYSALLVASLVVHVLFMNYVMAGTVWLAWSMMVRRFPFRTNDTNPISRHATLESILNDWLAPMLSGAITAGIAPLLFIQILYHREFYTANLLLSHRWMSILPILIIGFYSLYVLRTPWLARRHRIIQCTTSLLPLACVVFVGYSWTENHLLSVRSGDYWRRFYGSNQTWYWELQLVPRLALWSIGSIPTTCLWLAWQVHYRRRHRIELADRTERRLARVALFGVFGSAIAGLVYFGLIPSMRSVILSPLARVYLVLAIGGLVVQAIGWLTVHRSQRILRFPLSLMTVGLIATLLGMSVCRESIRLATLGEERLQELLPQHQAAMEVDGFWLFVLFLIINLGMIFWCFRWVRIHWRLTNEPSEDKNESLQKASNLQLDLRSIKPEKPVEQDDGV